MSIWLKQGWLSHFMKPNLKSRGASEKSLKASLERGIMSIFCLCTNFQYG